MAHVDEAPIKDGIHNFLLASTDTAMRHASVIGDIKQIAEMEVPAQFSEALEDAHDTSGLQHALVEGQRGADLPPVDRVRWARGGHPPGHHPLLHEHSSDCVEILQTGAEGKVETCSSRA